MASTVAFRDHAHRDGRFAGYSLTANDPKTMTPPRRRMLFSSAVLGSQHHRQSRVLMRASESELLSFVHFVHLNRLFDSVALTGRAAKADRISLKDREVHVLTFKEASVRHSREISLLHSERLI